MNKLLIVLLAVCLVSVHAFVKRDAPAETSPDFAAQIKNQIENFGAQAAKILDSENVKKQWNDLADIAKDTFDKIKSAGQVKPEVEPKA